MPPALLDEVVAALMVVVTELSGYRGPMAAPRIHPTPPAELQQNLCKGPCGVHAYYLEDHGVVLRDDLDVAGDVRARSILLHELVHHAQSLNGRFSDLPACERWYLREEEAYRVQNAYLSKLRTGMRFAFDFLPDRCKDAGQPGKAPG